MNKGWKEYIIYFLIIVVTAVVTFCATSYVKSSIPAVVVDRGTGRMIVLAKPLKRGESLEYGIILDKNFGPYQIEQSGLGRRIALIVESADLGGE